MNKKERPLDALFYFITTKDFLVTLLLLWPVTIYIPDIKILYKKVCKAQKDDFCNCKPKIENI
jgi:hypothetical protein